MITKEQAQKLKKMIKALVEAEVADSWKGGGPPEDIPLIEAELRAAKAELNAFIVNLTKS